MDSNQILLAKNLPDFSGKKTWPTVYQRKHPKTKID